jgi:hypothetical protein
MATATARTLAGTASPPASRQGAARRATIRAFVERRPVPTFYAPAFAIVVASVVGPVWQPRPGAS